jgi:hypothetical protein
MEIQVGEKKIQEHNYATPLVFNYKKTKKATSVHIFKKDDQRLVIIYYY